MNRGRVRRCSLLPALLVVAIADTSAGSISLTWDPPPNADNVHYRIHYGLEPGVYTQTKDVFTGTEALLDGLEDCTTYYIRATTVAADGSESPFSNEVSGWARPELDLAHPPSACSGSNFELILQGVNFQDAAELLVSDPSHVDVHSAVVDSCWQLTAQVTVDPQTPPSAVGVIVRNPDGSYGEVVDLLSVVNCSTETTTVAWTAEGQNPNGAWSDSSWSDRSFRILLDGDSITASGSTVQLTLRGRSSGSYRVRRVSLVQREGETLDGVDGSFREVTFGGSWDQGATVPSDGSVTSDPLPFDLVAGEDLFLTYWLPSGYPTAFRTGGLAPTAWVISGVDRTSTVDWDDLSISTVRSQVYAAEMLEVVSPVGGADCQSQQEGSSCDDGSSCTSGDACEAGVCIGTPVDCSNLDGPCHDGVCNQTTGACEALPANEGGSCDDGISCTIGDACQSGACIGAFVDCSGFDDSCHDGVCNELTGACEALPANEGGSCDDGSLCTIGDSCQAGTCSGNSVDCSGLDDPCHVGVCTEATGSCAALPLNDGGACEVGGPIVTEEAWSARMQNLAGEWLDSTWSDRTFRVLLKGDKVTRSGSTVQLTLRGRSSGHYEVRRVSLVQRDGDTLDGIDSSFREVTFGGSWDAGASVPSNGSVTSDPVPFDLVAGQDLFVTYWLPAAWPAVLRNGGLESTSWAVRGIDETGTIDWGGFSVSNRRNHVYVVETLEVVSPAAAPWCQVQPEGNACDDGDICTTGDTCQSGTCVGTATGCTNLGHPCDEGYCWQNINFSPESSSAPPGFVSDHGAVFDPARGYGWYEALNTRERDSSFAPELDTFVFASSELDWETVLPNGDYTVRIACGDASFTQGPHRVVVQGVVALDDVTTSAGEFVSRTLTVPVRTGRLQARIGGTGDYTMLNLLEIGHVPNSESSLISINFQPQEAAVPEGWLVDSGAIFDVERGYGWSEALLNRQRGEMVPGVLDTLVMSWDSEIWELELDDGAYDVWLSVGDASFDHHSQYVAVEGLSVVDDEPVLEGEHLERHVRVDVLDGRLTVEIGGAGDWTTLNYVVVQPVGAGF